MAEEPADDRSHRINRTLVALCVPKLAELGDGPVGNALVLLLDALCFLRVVFEITLNTQELCVRYPNSFSASHAAAITAMAQMQRKLAAEFLCRCQAIVQFPGKFLAGNTCQNRSRRDVGRQR